MYHCDESLSAHFHFSTIVWLSEYGHDFAQGGELAFLHNHSIPWLLVEPAVGRAAIFSGGWENIHGIKPIIKGSRWAFSVPVMLQSDDDLAAAQRRVHGAESPGHRFRDMCVRPPDKWAYPHCRTEWATTMEA